MSKLEFLLRFPGEKRIVGIAAGTAVVERVGIEHVQRRAGAEALDQIRVGDVEPPARLMWEVMRAVAAECGRAPASRTIVKSA